MTTTNSGKYNLQKFEIIKRKPICNLAIQYLFANFNKLLLLSCKSNVVVEDVQGKLLSNETT